MKELDYTRNGSTVELEDEGATALLGRVYVDATCEDEITLGSHTAWPQNFSISDDQRILTFDLRGAQIQSMTIHSTCKIENIEIYSFTGEI
jgi:hypothetical protein